MLWHELRDERLLDERGVEQPRMQRVHAAVRSLVFARRRKDAVAALSMTRRRR
jgi:hypothetical protein